MNRSLENLDRVCNWLVEDMGNIIADSEALLAAASEVADAGFAGVRAHFEESIASARAALSATLGPALDRASASAGRAGDWVRGNPWAAVGAAMAAGVLAGVLASRCLERDGDS